MSMLLMDINQCGCMVHHLTCILFLFLFQYKLTVPKMGNVADLLAVLTKETNIPGDKVRHVLCVSCLYVLMKLILFLKQLLPRLTLLSSKNNINTHLY